MNISKDKIWDVAVIGGGAAGMMAAGRAAERGKSVLLLEKNSILGKKLLITGGGRCNLTNYKLEVGTLVSSYKKRPKALFSVFSQFGVEQTMDFFHSHKMETKIEAEDRVFPLSNKAESVWKVLNSYITSKKVNIQTNSCVVNISTNKSNFIQIDLENDKIIVRSCIVATGGTSHPETGSTGDGFKWIKALGHTVENNNFALVPLALKNTWVKNLAGISLNNIKISLFQNGKKIDSKEGKILFTHVGISGPTILNMSSKVGDLLQYGEVIIEVDLLPDLIHAELKIALYNLMTLDINKKIKNSLNKIIPESLVNTILEISQINKDKLNHSITKEERSKLINTIKAIPLNVKALLGSDKAIISSGGVKIEEINFKTMMSKIIPNLYIVGDMLNIDRASGGYSLQLCWATGFVAGNSC